MPSANARWYKFGESLLVFSAGDITSWSGDAIVNAANEAMLGGGGVDGAIHKAAGPRLLEACKQVPEVKPGVRCPTGEARITRGGGLQAKYVIHTVGPVYKSAEESSPLLAAAYTSVLDLANKHRLENVAFPAISCGVYGYPTKEAAAIALNTLRDHAGNVKYAEFVLMPQAVMDAFVEVADKTEGFEAIPSAAPQISEPPQPAPAASGKTASLHPSSQAAQPTGSNEQSDSVCGGGAAAATTNAGAGGAGEVTSAAARAAPAPSVPSHTGGTDPGAGPSYVTAPSGTVGTVGSGGGPLASRR